MNVHKALDVYLDTLENPTTRLNYEIVLKDFLTNLKKVSDVTTEEILDFKGSLADKAPQTVTARLAAIRSFCDHCWTEGWLSTDPSLGVKNVHFERYGKAKNITFEEFKQFLGAADTQDLIGIRDYILLRLIFIYGNVNKILKLEWAAHLPASMDAARAQYEKLLMEKVNIAYLQNGYMFFNLEKCENDKSLSLSAARKILTKYVKRAGFSEKYIDFQAMKRLRAKQIYEKTTSIEAVMKFCGHRSLKATKAFLKTLSL